MMVCTSKLLSESTLVQLFRLQKQIHLWSTVFSHLNFLEHGQVQVLSEGQPLAGHQRDVLILCSRLLSFEFF